MNRMNLVKGEDMEMEHRTCALCFNESYFFTERLPFFSFQASLHFFGFALPEKCFIIPLVISGFLYSRAPPLLNVKYN